MTKWDFLPRAFLAAILAITAPICALAQQPQLKIFDAHLHYNDDTVTVYSVDEALDIFRRNGVAGILANSLEARETRHSDAGMTGSLPYFPTVSELFRAIDYSSI